MKSHKEIISTKKIFKTNLIIENTIIYSLFEFTIFIYSFENKPTSLLVVLLKKALGGISPSSCDRQVTATVPLERARYSALIAFS